MTSLAIDVRQLFAHSVLSRFNRLKEADVQFTFIPGDVYLSSFAEAMKHIDAVGFKENDPDLLKYAQVFERYVTDPIDEVDPKMAALVSAALYWLSGYSANALVIAKAIHSDVADMLTSAELLISVLARKNVANLADSGRSVCNLIFEYVVSGNEDSLGEARKAISDFAESFLSKGEADEYIVSNLLKHVFTRLSRISFWSSIHDHAAAPKEAWQQYMRYQVDKETPVLDLWPSQRKAIAKGLLDGKSSMVVRMPTSSGKTKMTELVFVNDLFTDQNRRCLYLAPYRALVGEVENDIGQTLGKLGFPVASLYGGSEANELEVELTDVARVTIATPEKISSVLKLTGGNLSDFGTVVLDEGHLLDSGTRGVAYELQLAELRKQLAELNRAVFLSAVLPNSDEIASWLGGTPEALAEDAWQPTSMRVGIVTWPRYRQARLTYAKQTGQPVTDQFFVPRLLQEDEWQELNPETRRMRTYRFPEQGDNGTIAVALAFQAAKDGQVIIYTRRPDWANSIARKAIERISLERPIDTNLVDDSNRDALDELADYLRASLGEQSLLPYAVSQGFALHHSGIPQRIRLVIEDEYRCQTLRLLIATNTIAQGVNFPAKTVIVHSLPYTDAPVRDFWNLAGRAGRAMKETEGEVYVLATGSTNSSTLRRFLNIQNVERVESRILYFVTRLLNEYPTVSEETISRLLNDSEEGDQMQSIVRTIDAHLLEVIAEDLEVDDNDANVESLVENLFATYQASVFDLESGTSYQAEVAKLFEARRSNVLAAVPNGGTRKAYARTGLSVESSMILDESLDSLHELFQQHPNLNTDSLFSIIDIACKAVELESFDSGRLTAYSYEWIETGRYDKVYKIDSDSFGRFEDCVKYVENVICYRLPWVLNGFVRLIEVQDATSDNQFQDDIPEWFYSLPDFLRYGVNRKELVWVMSIGFSDRDFSQWLLELFNNTHDRGPRSFREMLNWVLEERMLLRSKVSAAWPSYLLRLLENIVDRYSRINELLNT